MSEASIETLVKQYDEARERGDASRMAYIEEQIREITKGKPRRLSGVAHFELPRIAAED